MSVSLKLLLAPDAHVPDLLTRIRILEGVAVVGQKDKVDKFFWEKSNWNAILIKC